MNAALWTAGFAVGAWLGAVAMALLCVLAVYAGVKGRGRREARQQEAADRERFDRMMVWIASAVATEKKLHCVIVRRPRGLFDPRLIRAN